MVHLLPEAAPSRYVFELGGEKLLPVGEVPAVFARLTGRPRPHLAVVRRWTRTGIRAVPLPTVMVAGRRYSSAAAVEWWIRATTAAADAPSAPVSASADLPITAAEKAVLRRAGILPKQEGS